MTGLQALERALVELRILKNPEYFSIDYLSMITGTPWYRCLLIGEPLREVEYMEKQIFFNQLRAEPKIYTMYLHVKDELNDELGHTWQSTGVQQWDSLGIKVKKCAD